MRNMSLPMFSSQYCSLDNITKSFSGSNEIIQVPNSEVSMQMDPKANAYSSSFVFSSKPYSNRLGDGGFTINPAQTFINDDQSGLSLLSFRLTRPCPAADYQTSLPRYDSIPQIPRLEVAIQNARKRPIEVFDDGAGRKNSVLEEWSSRKKKKPVSSEGQWHHQANKEAREIQTQRFQVPVKRSQKLSDKITVLQKLVSPYGKTDTASVLQEASLYIKLLQGQIRNLFQILSTSFCRVTPLHQQNFGAEEQDLQSRGLCLVPISVTQTLTREDQADPQQAMEQSEF